MILFFFSFFFKKGFWRTHVLFFFLFRDTIVISDGEEDIADATDALKTKKSPDTPPEDESDIVITDFIPAKRRRLNTSNADQKEDKKNKLLNPSLKCSVEKKQDFRNNWSGVNASELYCRSLISIMKTLDKCSKSVARMTILRTLHVVAYGASALGSEDQSTDVREMIRISRLQDDSASCLPSPEDADIDEDRQFCASLAPILNDMTGEKQSLAKLKIQEILHKCQFYRI